MNIPFIWRSNYDRLEAMHDRTVQCLADTRAELAKERARVCDETVDRALNALDMLCQALASRGLPRPARIELDYITQDALMTQFASYSSLVDCSSVSFAGHGYTPLVLMGIEVSPHRTEPGAIILHPTNA